MRLREKLTVEEKVSLALELIKRERSLEEISEHYRVSHTTAYKIRNQFLEGGRRALGGVPERRAASELEARVRALEDLVARAVSDVHHEPRVRRGDVRGGSGARA
jgi:transposase-like protein